VRASAVPRTHREKEIRRHLLLYAGVTPFLLIAVFPIFWMAVTAFKQEADLYRIEDLVEKPLPQKAPSNLAVIGRYILTPEIFEALEKTPPGKNNEIQLTDALRILAAEKGVYGKRLNGTRYDAGDKLGFLKATVEFGLKSPDLGKPFQQYLKNLKL